MRSILKDPDSAKYSFLVEPQKVNEFKFMDTSSGDLGVKEEFCYELVILVNAKNSYGGYAGEQPLLAICKKWCSSWAFVTKISNQILFLFLPNSFLNNADSVGCST